jgi:SAM-dependent methyltransferase
MAGLGGRWFFVILRPHYTPIDSVRNCAFAMISPATKADARAVARHYEELDRFYREIWGEHVHHGLWLTGHESPERAVVQLVEQVARRAELRAGAAVCDVGCGYGATARLLADRYGARVTAITVTPQQAEYARNVRPGSENPTYILGDWLNNQLPAGEFDAVVACESTEQQYGPLVRILFGEDLVIVIEEIELLREIERVFREDRRLVRRCCLGDSFF